MGSGSSGEATRTHWRPEGLRLPFGQYKGTGCRGSDILRRVLTSGGYSTGVVLVITGGADECRTLLIVIDAAAFEPGGLVCEIEQCTRIFGGSTDHPNSRPYIG